MPYFHPSRDGPPHGMIASWNDGLRSISTCAIALLTDVFFLPTVLHRFAFASHGNGSFLSPYLLRSAMSPSCLPISSIPHIGVSPSTSLSSLLHATFQPT